ncbi:UNVERIFIED_CONTAM: hypothetical protein K2H54_042057 [Gekko kuhli]
MKLASLKPFDENVLVLQDRDLSLVRDQTGVPKVRLTETTEVEKPPGTAGAIPPWCQDATGSPAGPFVPPKGQSALGIRLHSIPHLGCISELQTQPGFPPQASCGVAAIPFKKQEDLRFPGNLT